MHLLVLIVYLFFWGWISHAKARESVARQYDSGESLGECVSLEWEILQSVSCDGNFCRCDRGPLPSRGGPHKWRNCGLLSLLIYWVYSNCSNWALPQTSLQVLVDVLFHLSMWTSWRSILAVTHIRLNKTHLLLLCVEEQASRFQTQFAQTHLGPLRLFGHSCGLGVSAISPRVPVMLVWALLLEMLDSLSIRTKYNTRLAGTTSIGNAPPAPGKEVRGRRVVERRRPWRNPLVFDHSDRSLNGDSLRLQQHSLSCWGGLVWSCQVSNICHMAYFVPFWGATDFCAPTEEGSLHIFSENMCWRRILPNTACVSTSVLYKDTLPLTLFPYLHFGCIIDSR